MFIVVNARSYKYLVPQTDFSIDIVGLKIPTDGRQSSWLFTGPAEKQLQPSGQNGASLLSVISVINPR